MADTIRVVDYYYTTTADKAGEGARLLGVLRDARTNLLALSAFPSKRKTQVDFVPSDSTAFAAAAKAAKVKLSRPKKVFLIQGDDRVGAIQELLAKLVGTLQAPIAKLVRTMNEVPAKFVRTLAAVRDAKSGT